MRFQGRAWPTEARTFTSRRTTSVKGRRIVEDTRSSFTRDRRRKEKTDKVKGGDVYTKTESWSRTSVCKGMSGKGTRSL